MAALKDIARHLQALVDIDPVAAIQGARQIDLACDGAERVNRMGLRAAILVDAGQEAGDREAVEEAVKLLRELHATFPVASVSYNLANALTSVVGYPPHDAGWLDHMERTRDTRLEARQLFASVAVDDKVTRELRTQAWTNLANQLSQTWRLGEAHDARLAALRIDPTNGVAAGSAARDLLWLDGLGGCAPTTRTEAALLARVAAKNRARIEEFAGISAARHLTALAAEVGEAQDRKPHADPFVRWVEQERLTLAPTVELVEPSLGHIDWLMLPGILEREEAAPARPPPVYAMFNLLKADFVLARDLAWRATTQEWPRTARFADTLDYARYNPETSALVLAHRSALDLLDKVAVLANHYFELGEDAERVHFRTLWRVKKPASDGTKALKPSVEAAVRAGALALLGLVELAADYDTGWRQPQRDLRNAGTHRFVVLHDEHGERGARDAPEIERHSVSTFEREVMQALRVARSAIQALVFAIRQRETALRREIKGVVGTLHVPDHAWVRGEE
ncbi:MAG: LA2681 family HEPN domain-containing protein [Pseudomonadota bacterium]|nr:LA2681 family HEPN domain-containing protein [Pseudomonadota bacterium]